MRHAALWLCDVLLAYVASGEHSIGYSDRVKDAREAVGYIRFVYYPGTHHAKARKS